jgi:cell division septation protein DedD
MVSRLTIILYAIMIMALIVKPITVRAETIAIPVFLDYQQLQLLMMRDEFKGPNDTAQYLLDEAGCTSITFSEPHLSAVGELLRVDAKILSIIGVPTSGTCKAITRWSGRTVVTGKFSLVSGQPLSAEFKVQSARIYDQEDRPLTNSPVLQAVKEQLHLLLSRYRLDLKPETDSLKDLLPYFIPHYPADRLIGMIDSLRIGHLLIRSSGLNVELRIDVETFAKAGPESILSKLEMQQLEQRYRSWDAFLTFVIKEAAIATRTEELRAALFEILLDARYQFKSILIEPSQSTTDPVKQLFIRSWERLMPIMRKISVHSPKQNFLHFLSFITAADALNALNRWGPAIGLDISTDGLRRLARLLNDDPSIDPMKYLNETDPILQELFDFGTPGEVIQQKKPHGFNFQLIRPVYAANPRDRLNQWVPTTDDLKSYLLEIRNLLLKEADARIHSSPIPQKYARIFRKLMLAAAWQESCWRQYIIHNRKVVPLISGTGDIGLLQVNEKVWRGFYSPSKLRWDITYNAHAGSEILYKFMVNYALKQKEYKHGGGLSNLARATYSAYNGGPSQLNRYRKKDVPAAQKKIDVAFWEKYQQVHQGQELAVAQCLGVQASSSTTALPQTNHGPKQSGSKQVTRPKESQRIENVGWIRSHNPGDFTLQLATMSGELAAREFIKQQSQAGSFAYYKKKQKGRNFYVVIYGSFTNRADAKKATARFASLKPMIRNFGSIQKIISK